MTDIVTVVVIVLALTIGWYVWRSDKKLKELLKADLSQRLDDKYVLEHIIHTRSSLNGIYAAIAMITTVLAFMGYKAVNDITNNASQAATAQILRDTQINVEQWKKNVVEVNGLLDDLRNRYSATRHVIGTVDSFIDTLDKRFQKLYVVPNIAVSQTKHKYFFSELKTTEGLMLPNFKEVPSVRYLARDKDGYVIPESGFAVTASSIDFPAVQLVVDLWLYGVRK